MRFCIVGAERLTGDDVHTVTEAHTGGAAEAKAHRMNVLTDCLRALSKPAPGAARERPGQPAAPHWSWAAGLNDERSLEVVRTLDPDLGDAVRVLRRLGVEGSFEELVAMAREQLNGNRKGKRWRRRRGLFR